MGFLSIVGGVFAGVGKWFVKNPTVLAIGLLTAAFALVIVSKNSEIKTLRTSINDPKYGYQARITTLTSGLAIARGNVATLNSTLITQSSSILALKAQGDRQDNAFDQLIKGMDKANASTAKRIAAIDAARPGADKCQSAFDLVRSSVQ